MKTGLLVNGTIIAVQVKSEKDLALNIVSKATVNALKEGTLSYYVSSDVPFFRTLENRVDNLFDANVVFIPSKFEKLEDITSTLTADEKADFDVVYEVSNNGEHMAYASPEAELLHVTDIQWLFDDLSIVDEQLYERLHTLVKNKDTWKIGVASLQNVNVIPSFTRLLNIIQPVFNAYSEDEGDNAKLWLSNYMINQYIERLDHVRIHRPEYGPDYTAIREEYDICFFVLLTNLHLELYHMPETEEEMKHVFNNYEAKENEKTFWFQREKKDDSIYCQTEYLR